jgi:hypothetical protein
MSSNQETVARRQRAGALECYVGRIDPHGWSSGCSTVDTTASVDAVRWNYRAAPTMKAATT